MAQWGLRYDLVDQTDIRAVENAILDDTRLIWHLRMAAHRLSARAVVELLRSTPEVYDVRWPGFSGMVSFRHPRAHEISTATRLFTLAESLGGVESLIELPQAMTHNPSRAPRPRSRPTSCDSAAASKTPPTSSPIFATHSHQPQTHRAGRLSACTNGLVPGFG
jgi:cystathionine beta-lyase/cystathionine gamma-synthase